MASNDPVINREAGKKAIRTRLSRMSPAERKAMTEAARAAYLQQLENEVDPGHELDPADRTQRAADLRKARLADAALRARREKLAAQRAAEAEAELDEILSAEAGAR